MENKLYKVCAYGEFECGEVYEAYLISPSKETASSCAKSCFKSFRDKDLCVEEIDFNTDCPLLTYTSTEFRRVVKRPDVDVSGGVS